MSFLRNRKILVVGGNGFVGNRIAARLIQHSALVSVLSRKGPKYEYPENKKINWIIGDALEPESIKDKINDAEIIIHSLGTLVDTTVTKFRQPGQAGTYQQINRDTFLKILLVLDSPKKIFYLSSSNPPPFLERYLTTKHESQSALFQSQHQGYALRPGFIYDWEVRKWSLPLRYAIKGWNQVYPTLNSFLPQSSISQKFLKRFEQGQPTSLNKIVESIAYIISKGSPNKILDNDRINSTSQLYDNLVSEWKNKEALNNTQTKF